MKLILHIGRDTTHIANPSICCFYTNVVLFASSPCLQQQCFDCRGDAFDLAVEVMMVFHTTELYGQTTIRWRASRVGGAIDNGNRAAVQ